MLVEFTQAISFSCLFPSGWKRFFPLEQIIGNASSMLHDGSLIVRVTVDLEMRADPLTATMGALSQSTPTIVDQVWSLNAIYFKLKQNQFQQK